MAYCAGGGGASIWQEDEMKLYRLIWNRFVACQMMPALYDQTTIDVGAKGKNGVDYLFRATGSVLKFDGFLQGLPGRQGPDRRGRRRAEAPPAAGDRRRAPALPRPSGPSSTSPSRRRATTKPRWSSGWNPMASAARPPTRRFSPPFRSASTSRRKAAASRPPSWAWW